MSKSKLKRTIFYYRGNEVKFYQAEKCVLINATQLGKPFRGREPKKYLRRDEAKDFINALATTLEVSPEDLINIKQGGYPQGTLMHEDIAVEYAKWVNTDLADWTRNRLKELAEVGVAGGEAPTSEAMKRVTDGLLERVERLQARVKALEKENKELATQNEALTERVQETDKILKNLNSVIDR